ncbi:MAG: type II toxin-antitoxin system VapB family antitoxin [Rhodocyclaceae bacterium]|nr:MAG: type II toxin-antitoxin system VapB family antitoxin [Rhodocyclaceae bacterium]
MRTTVTLDDDLLADVEQLSGIRDRSQLLREALLEMRHRLASQRLALLAGTEPDVVAPPRRRSPHFVSEPDAEPYRAKKSPKSKS